MLFESPLEWFILNKYNGANELPTLLKYLLKTKKEKKKYLLIYPNETQIPYPCDLTTVGYISNVYVIKITK